MDQKVVAFGEISPGYVLASEDYVAITSKCAEGLPIVHRLKATF